MVTESPSNESKHEATNPYFLHHSDHPGMVLVSKPLNGDNYLTWCRAMTISLNAKNKLDFIDGPITAPSAKNKPDDHAAWKRCNDMILSWILNSLTADLADNIIYSTTAQEVWEDLHDRFSQSNGPRIFQIERDISCLSQDQITVAAYYTKLKGLWDELSSYNDTICSCGADHKRRRLMQFLMGLNESYNGIRGHILLMNPLPDVTKAYSSSCKKRSSEAWALQVRCLAYATAVHVPHELAPRTQRCVFLGYPARQKAYKLYDLTTHKILSSSDVVFHENIFPYASPSSTSSTSQNSALVIPHCVFNPPLSDMFSPVQPNPPPDPVPYFESSIQPTPISPISSPPASPPPTPALHRPNVFMSPLQLYKIMFATK
ncbi:hypothetical protein RHSIM_Rhsim05G0165100 [Rhododendron simsii]|uniref:Retrotransposon Copia-like N-terminal domain-containing protein n=1 Tax=Rhododendron simsii TaxID=118357 RepID=A0A834H1X0_RHOSS|nr:hypothetical protein RHSIM_Rhsim05G0165100 [Rhododendron simsii]